MTEEECILAHAAHGPFSTDSKGKYPEYAMVGEYEKGSGLGPDASVPMALYPFAQGFNGGVDLETAPGEYSYPSVTAEGTVLNIFYTANRRNFIHCQVECR